MGERFEDHAPPGTRPNPKEGYGVARTEGTERNERDIEVGGPFRRLGSTGYGRTGNKWRNGESHEQFRRWNGWEGTGALLGSSRHALPERQNLPSLWLPGKAYMTPLTWGYDLVLHILLPRPVPLPDGERAPPQGVSVNRRRKKTSNYQRLSTG